MSDLPPIEWINTTDASRTRRPPTGGGFEKARLAALEYQRQQKAKRYSELAEKARRKNNQRSTT